VPPCVTVWHTRGSFFAEGGNPCRERVARVVAGWNTVKQGVWKVLEKQGSTNCVLDTLPGPPSLAVPSLCCFSAIQRENHAEPSPCCQAAVDASHPLQRERLVLVEHSHVSRRGTVIYSSESGDECLANERAKQTN
jgi:hypothetical protein